MRSPKSLSKSVKANATFLTECSFGVAHDRLVQVITDVQPFEPYWEELSVIDLSRKNLDSVARLKEFLPRLDSLCLNTNQVSYLSGIPSTVRSLSVASNALTSVASFNHLRNLENLDISNNQLDSLRQLECLRHLRELRADGNKVTSVDGLQQLDGLVKLSLEGNAIHDIDLTECRWTRLEMLHLAKNRIENINGLATLPSLVLLNLDKNCLGELDAHGVMPRLRILRVSGNRLAQLNAGSFPNLRTLYADDNHLGNLVKASRLTKLENLSLRNQRGRLLNLSVRDVRDVKRLYLSGNPLKAGFMDEPCYNLTYLELAGCRLAALPANLAKLVPNLRNLNLNYNFVEDVRPLHGLSRLKKLTMVGSRLKTTKELIRVLRGMPEAEVLDFRMNPCTLPWYVPLLYKNKSVPGGPDGEAGDARGEKGWQEVDGEFRRGLPVEVYAHRLAYRGHIMRACPGLRSLDGVGVTEKERAKAGELLATMGLRSSVGA
ncbi:L domain-like protein [Gloeophyllum trabeum ATCC 11539]|uniref:L domain-like protein n=1 Tax=Gloeophyllum trabeum (strain ATCC 11539 / FP-39264 / Madison 617) TaxID=670483 RepID=S7Q5E0_GLOTA|nr:L domain-like protein [Gloeophyllum trabeum ATCC 11539]EPQ54712.1 L domain-like protein [Gloeophyllum trabeum ATCC 11539]